MESPKPPIKRIQQEGTHSLGRYQVQEELGRGAMGAVYKAFDPVIARTVALKTILIDERAPDRSQMIERLKQEAKAAGGLDHPNIITIYDVGEENGAVYLSMQFVKGTTLASLLTDAGVPSLPTLLSWADQILTAVGFAHACGVIHRDLKPANLMVTEQGAIKVLDFGIAKIDNTSLTQTGLVIGTPGYMSPEQITGKKVDHRADIFSLGAVFYELLTRERAFAGDIATTLYKIVHEDPVAPSLINPAVPGGIDAVIRKALAKDPKDRFQTCEEMRQALQDQSVPAPVAARMVAPGARRSSQTAAPPQVWPRLILGLALVVAGLATWAFFTRSRTGTFPLFVAKLENKIQPTLTSGTDTRADSSQVHQRAADHGTAPAAPQNQATANASVSAAAANSASATPASSNAGPVATLQPVAAQGSSDQPAIDGTPASGTPATSPPEEISQKPVDPSQTASTPEAETTDNDQAAGKNPTGSATASSGVGDDEKQIARPEADNSSAQNRDSEQPLTVNGFTRSDVPDLLRKADSYEMHGYYRLARYQYRLVLQLAPNNVRARAGLRRMQALLPSR